VSFLSIYQNIVCDWGARMAGRMIGNRRDRAIRIVEEAVELAQSEQCDSDMIRRVVESVLKRPVGIPKQELGGVIVTTLAYAGAAGVDAQAIMENEIRKVLGMPYERFHKRIQEKISEGLVPPDAIAEFQDHMRVVMGIDDVESR
jgi:hypothetical protein